MSKNHRLRGKALIVIGLFLVIAAGVLYYGNLSDDKSAGEASAALLHQIDSGNAEEANICGKLTINALDITLPVLSDWSEYGLTQAPCRYSGSVADGDMIIAGHNYSSHFYYLKDLVKGDMVQFIDKNDNKYIYIVKQVDILDGTSVSEMKAGDWDLTLFTCTQGGKQRVTVRCVVLE